MATNTPSDAQLRRQLAALKEEVAIHQGAKDESTNKGERRTDDILIAEARVSMAWIQSLLGEKGPEMEEYRRLLP